AATAAPSPRILSELLALVDVPAPLASRGPALAAGAALAAELGDGVAARRLEDARRAAANVLREGAPPEHRAALAAVRWAALAGREPTSHALAPMQVEQLEAIVRALASRDRLG